MKQVDYFAGRWDRRRTDEWKVTFAIWTLEIGGIVYVPKPELVPWFAVAAFVIGYAYFWLKGISDRNYIEIEQMKFYQKEAETIMRDPSHSLRVAKTVERSPFFAFLKGPSMQFQLLSVIVLAFLFYFVPRKN